MPEVIAFFILGSGVGFLASINMRHPSKMVFPDSTKTAFHINETERQARARRVYNG